MLAYFLFRLSKIDLEIRQIPDEYNLAICILAVGAGGFSLARVFLGLSLMIFASRLMGLGDAKLFGALSLLFGTKIFSIFFFSFVIAALYCLVKLIRKEICISDTIAFAPFISTATLGVLLSAIFCDFTIMFR